MDFDTYCNADSDEKVRLKKVLYKDVGCGQTRNLITENVK